MHQHLRGRGTGQRHLSLFGSACSVLLLAGTLTGCGGGEKTAQAPSVSTPGARPASGSSGKTIGVALASMSYNFYKGLRQGVDDELDAQGFKKEVVVANDSASDQQQQVDQLIQKGVSAIILVPVDTTQAVNPIKAANGANIPVLTVDRHVSDPQARVACAVTTDNVALGEEAGKYCLKLLCDRHKLDPTKPADVKKLKATVVQLWGLETVSNAQDRAKGWESIFNKSNTPLVTVIKGVGDFNAKKSQEVTAPILTAHPEVELIYCHNDDNAIGALHAVIDVKKGREKPDDPKRIFIVGVDGNPDAIEEIRKGNIEATVAQEPIDMGREVVRQTKKLLDGGTPDPQVKVPHYLITQKVATEEKAKVWSDQLKGGA